MDVENIDLSYPYETGTDYIVKASEIDSLYSENRADICKGTLKGRKALDEIIAFCREIVFSDNYVFDIADDAFLGAGENMGSIKAACIAGCYGRSESFSSEKIDNLIISALLHNVGLYDQENSEGIADMSEHVMIGYKALLTCADDRVDGEVRDAVLQHHEKNDGTGYPFGVKGDTISETAQLIGLIDLFLAISKRTGVFVDIKKELCQHRPEFKEQLFDNFCAFAFGTEERVE
jgi:HD-GYP domain-containing protein (c-di-GMP phosphodiesterase class II)